MLTLNVVIARMLGVINDCFTSQFETGPTLKWFPNHEGYTIPNIEMKVYSPNVPCLARVLNSDYLHDRRMC